MQTREHAMLMFQNDMSQLYTTRIAEECWVSSGVQASDREGKTILKRQEECSNFKTFVHRSGVLWDTNDARNFI